MAAAPRTGSPARRLRPSPPSTPRAPIGPASSTRSSTTPRIIRPPSRAEPEPEAKPAFEEPGPPSDAAEAPAEAPPEAPERSIFDAEEIDLDEFDLELDDEPEAPAEESAPEPPREVRRDPAVEDDTGEAPAPVQPREDSADGEEGEGEDLLGATPDFLQDAPEGEDLWFEQGPPKDFDFDDDDGLGAVGSASSSAHGPSAASPPASLIDASDASRSIAASQSK